MSIFPDVSIGSQFASGFIAASDFHTKVDLNLDALAARVQDILSWQTPTLLNSWAAFGSGYATPSYRLKAGIVYMQGSMASGTSGTTVFTLPVGMRPLARKTFTGQANGGLARIDVFSTGIVQVVGFLASGTNGFVSLDNVIFIAEQ